MRLDSGRLQEYRKLHKRWADLAASFKANGSRASNDLEQQFWALIASRLLEDWCRADHFRTQFRNCEFSKIGGIVCRNAGVKRKRVVALVADCGDDKTSDSESEGHFDDEIDTVNDDEYDSLADRADRISDQQEATERAAEAAVRKRKQ